MGLRLDTDLLCIAHLHFMPFLSRLSRSREAFENWGLVLQPTRITRGQSRRVGLLYIQMKMKLHSSPVDGIDEISNAEWLEYESKDSFGNYVVTII